MPGKTKKPTRAWPIWMAVGALLFMTLPTTPTWAQDRGGEDEVAGVNFPLDVERAPRPVARATRIDAPIRVDGRLDEAAWEEAQVISHFIQSQPRTGYLATEPTEVRILYDMDNLYVGAVLHESEPGRTTLQTLERDFPGASTRDSDMFAITLDTFLDRRNSFIFLVNPMGALRDGQTFDDSRNLDFAWRGAVQVETQITDEGWTLEMAIPWSTLRFDPTREELSFGMNLLRRVRWKNEDSYWAPVDRHDPVHRMSRAGTLVGLEGIRGGRNLRVKPYLSSGRSSGAAVDPGEVGGSFDGGGDLKYGITPGLTLDLTLNTDFSQVEVDQERVNLTRFNLFFPEQRDFFVENSGSFTFGDVTEREYRTGSSLRDFTLFHSRSIGLTEDGRPVPILGGGRLSGRVGQHEVGVLNLQTRSAHGLPPENFAVARLRRSLGDGSDVGVLFVNREATGRDGEGAHNRSFGVDANVRLFDHLILNTYAAGVDGPDLHGNRFAGRLAVAWRDRLLNTSAFVRHVGNDFQPGVGFVRRPGTRHHYATVGIHPRPDWLPVQEVNPYLEFHYIAGTGPAFSTRTGSSLATRRATVGLDVEFLDGGELSLEVDDRFERLDEPFRVRGEAVVPVGPYRFREVEVGYQSSQGRTLSGRVDVGGGGFFAGERVSARMSGQWRPSFHLSLDASVDHNRVSLPDTETFTADVLGARIRYAHSTSLFASSFVQYNTATEQMVTSLRLNYIHAPLSDLFITYTERRDRTRQLNLERIFTVKVTRTLAL